MNHWQYGHFGRGRRQNICGNAKLSVVCFLDPRGNGFEWWQTILRTGMSDQEMQMRRVEAWQWNFVGYDTLQIHLPEAA